MVDGRRFRNACHEAARRTGGTVTGFHLAHGVTPNFPQGIIATSRDTGPLPFVDAPAPVAALKALPEFRVLTYTDACRPFEAAAWPSIDPSDLKYWNPTIVGEALFNYWDCRRPSMSRPGHDHYSEGDRPEWALQCRA